MASEKMVIPKAIPADQRGGANTFFKKGVHVVKIKSVDWIRTPNKNIKKNQKGNPGFEFTFSDKNGKEIRENYWLGKAQYRLDDMLKEFGVDNTKSDFDAAKTIGKYAYAIIAEEFHLQNGVQKMNKGYKVSYPVVVEFKKYISGQPAPVVDESALTITREVGSGKEAPEVSAEEAPTFGEEQQAESPGETSSEAWDDAMPKF